MTTPTPIATFEDILTAMENNPRLQAAMRQHVLDQEFLQLPAIVRELQQTVAELAQLVRDYIATTNARLDRLEQDVKELKADVATLKTDVSTLITDVGALQGSDLENRARRNILNIAMNELRLARGRILLSAGGDTEPGFLETINTAEEAGLITEAQADHILVADIIIRARRIDDKRYVHAVFEVSRTIRQDDIARAHHRAATVEAAAGEPAIAAVVGEFIQPPQQQQANAMNVKVLLPPLLRHDQPSDTTAAPI